LEQLEIKVVSLIRKAEFNRLSQYVGGSTGMHKSPGLAWVAICEDTDR